MAIIKSRPHLFTKCHFEIVKSTYIAALGATTMKGEWAKFDLNSNSANIATFSSKNGLMEISGKTPKTGQNESIVVPNN